MSLQGQREAELDELIKIATKVSQEGDSGHKLLWDMISARDLEAHAKCTQRGCRGFVFIKIATPPSQNTYSGTAIRESCPIR